MSIVFNCKCGKPLKAKVELAGRRIKCPFCGVLLSVPEPSPENTAARKDQAGLASLEGAIAIDDSPLEKVVSAAPAAAASADRPASVTLATPDSGAPSSQDGTPLRYKVITTKDMGFVAKFDPARMEESLNEWSRKGYSINFAFRVTIHARGEAHDEIVFILER